MIEEVGVKYKLLSNSLLKNKNGNIAKSLEKEHGKDAEDINYEIFRRWLEGGGLVPVSWATLIDVLEDIGLKI